MEIYADKEKPERPLSPVLNSNVFRRKIFDRKRNSKSRVNLSERFNSNIKSSTNEFEFKKPISPVSKLKTKSNLGFSTASGKSIHISPDAIKKRLEIYKTILQTDLNDNPTVFRKDFSFINPVRLIKDNNSEIDSYESSISDSQIVLAADNAVANLNESSNNEKDFIGFTVDEYNWSCNIIKRFELYLNELSNYEPPLKKAKLDEIKEEILDSTLCNVFAEEDLSLIASVSNAHKDENDVKNNEVCSGFLTATGKNIPISEQAWNKGMHLFDNLDIEPMRVDCDPKNDRFYAAQLGFNTASGKKIEISEKALKNSEKLFCNEGLAYDFREFNTATEDVINVPEEDLKEDESILNKHVLMSVGKVNEKFTGFSTAAGDMIKVSEEALERGKKLFVTDLTSSANFSGFATAGGEAIKISDNAWKKSSEIFSDEILALPVGDSKSDYSSDVTIKSSECVNTPIKTLTPISSKSSGKRRLGISACKQISISKHSLAKAMLRFKDLDDGIDSFSPSSKSHCVYSSTPLKESTPQQILAKNKPNFLAEFNITPVKHIKAIANSDNESVIMQVPTPGDTHTWMENVIKECNTLQSRLRIMEKRKKALEEQQKFLESQNNARIRPILGVLSEKKVHSRISLKQAARDARPGHEIKHNSVTLQNADSVHFSCVREKNEFPAVVYSEDGAVIIPNLENLIGLSEIEVAFKAMISVDPKLIPKGWIKNHFKLIVWKLASLDRNLSNVMTECLTFENVIQQLKYRYDREIDKAQRSALHRILEKDDVPQKRMVLCVSNIIKENGQFEIELTDGWYCILTIIDDILKFQINAKKIVIGAKLVMQGAEIINCDGCHPLEIPDHVRLKINYNCTRRAVWYARLGFQRNVKPFPISISSIHSDGGQVGCVQIQIIRLYPLRYLEKTSKGKSVWRNRKAEDKRQQEWENERMKELDMINQKVSDEYEKEMKSNGHNNSELSQVTLYKLFHDLHFISLKGTADFEIHQHNQELSVRISNEVNKLKKLNRQVRPVLKVLVIDRVKETKCTTVFNIWNATEEHLQLLQENSCFYVYNVSPSSNGELSSTNKTYFEMDNTKSKLKNFQRFLLSISSLQYSSSKPLLNEFDTVGTVVQVIKEQNFQDAWITDFSANLLLIKIFDGPHVCSLFDNITRGQSIAFLNILFCEPRVSFAQGIANQCSIITSFPQQKFLQIGLEEHNESLPKDLSKLLDNCDKKIQNACLNHAKGMGSSVSGSHLSALMEISESYSDAIDDSLEDNTMIPSRLTTTDVAMSLIDTDQYFEHV